MQSSEQPSTSSSRSRSGPVQRTDRPTYSYGKESVLTILQELQSWVESWPESAIEMDRGTYMFCCDLSDVANEAMGTTPESDEESDEGASMEVNATQTMTQAVLDDMWEENKKQRKIRVLADSDDDDKVAVVLSD
jgi:hypothetical protein